MIKSIIVAITLMLMQFGLHAQTVDTLKVQTSAVCETCKKTMENYMSFEKGVKSSDLDMNSFILTIAYDPAKTTPEKLRIAVTKSGYDADSLKADPKAFRRLPDCCKGPHNE